jgi:hypothetical protein
LALLYEKALIAILKTRSTRKMSLAKDYLKAIKKHLLEFAVWRLGDLIAPGDVGEMKGRQFIRSGTIRDIIPSFDFEVKSHQEDEIHFQTSDVSSVAVDAMGALPEPDITQSEVAIDLSFKKKGGVVFHAMNSITQAIDDMYFVKQDIEHRY